MIERKIALVLVAIAKVQLLCRFAEHHVILARQVLLSVNLFKERFSRIMLQASAGGVPAHP
jgi:hypothetical protein